MEGIIATVIIVALLVGLVKFNFWAIRALNKDTNRYPPAPCEHYDYQPHRRR